MKNTPNPIKIKLITVFCLISTFYGIGQKIPNGITPITKVKTVKDKFIRCATVENEQRLQDKNPNRLTKSQFENWLSPIIAKQKQKEQTQKSGITTYTIPVVIHIIHNGDPINTSSSHSSENISDAQAASQITVLNQDFRKLFGTPGFGNTGYKLGVDCLINFVLAKQDPYGVLTTGIEHINMGKADWTDTEIDALVKPETQWDPTRYLNIWSVRFSINLLGYAQFPSSSNLSGLNTSGGDANTDGVVVNYDALGTFAEDDGSFELNPNYNMGRTATHEIGHFLGLIHIWGDGNGDESTSSPDCSASDYCSDTPQVGWEHYNCDIFDTCPTIAGDDMPENYMDYTNDKCLNTFTAGQRDRMIAVLTNSPRRKELANSTVATPGFRKTLDAALRNIVFRTSGCRGSFIPSVTIENKGTTIVQSFSITYKIDNLSPISSDWNLELLPNTSTLLSFPEINLPSGNHTFTTEIKTLNNSTDLNSLNDKSSKSFTIPPLSQLIGDATPKVTLTLQCDRDGSETTWALKNSAGTTIKSGGPYEDATSATKLKPPVIEVFNLQQEECYTFTINDSYGDGINTNGGAGSYSLKDENNTVFASGSTFQFIETKSFKFSSNLNTNSFENSKQISLYPNPTNGLLKVDIPSELGLPNRLIITNSIGKVILKKENITELDLTVNTSSWSQGVYFMVLEKGVEKRTLKFLKE